MIKILPIIPFASSRQVLFRGETSHLLKKSMMCFDATLAAPKAMVTDSVYNLYPKNGYRKMLATFEQKLNKLGIKIFLDSRVNHIDISENDRILVSTNKNNSDVDVFDHVYFGMDERISENVLLNSNHLNDLTHFVPQHFIYMKCQKHQLANSIIYLITI